MKKKFRWLNIRTGAGQIRTVLAQVSVQALWPFLIPSKVVHRILIVQRVCYEHDRTRQCWYALPLQTYPRMVHHHDPGASRDFVPLDHVSNQFVQEMLENRDHC